MRIRELRGSQWDTILGVESEIPNDRDSLVYGTYRPGPDTTGPLPGTMFTPVSGMTFATPNETVTGIDMTGQLVVNAAGITFRNCIFRGDGADKMARATGGNDFKGARFVDCVFDGTGREGVFVDGISGGNFSLERCEFKRVVDAVGLTSAIGNVDILGCWMHDSAVFKWAPGTPGMPGFSDNRTHNDAIQFHVGANYTVRGNYLGGLRKNYSKTDPAQDPSIPDSADDFDNAGIILQQEVSTAAENKLRNILIEENWLHGGAAAFNIGYKFGNALNDNVVVRNNRFLRRISPGGGFYVYQHTSTSPAMSGNVFDDDDSPVTVNTYS